MGFQRREPSIYQDQAWTGAKEKLPTQVVTQFQSHRNQAPQEDNLQDNHKTITRRCMRNPELRIVYDFVGLEASAEIMLTMPILSS